MIVFYTFDNNLREETLDKRPYKTSKGILAHLEVLADRELGIGKWEHRPDRSTSLANVIGLYCCRPEDGQVVMAKYEPDVKQFTDTGG